MTTIDLNWTRPWTVSTFEWRNIGDSIDAAFTVLLPRPFDAPAPVLQMSLKTLEMAQLAPELGRWGKNDYQLASMYGFRIVLLDYLPFGIVYLVDEAQQKTVVINTLVNCPVPAYTPRTKPWWKFW